MRGGGSDLPKIKLPEFSGDPLAWPEWADIFTSKPIEDTVKMHHLKTCVTGSAKAAIAGLSFSSQAYHQAWEVLANKFGRPSVIVGTYMRKIYSHPPVRHDDSSSIVKFADTVTNTVNVLKQLGYAAYL